MKPTAGNPRGFWEHQPIRDLNDEILARFGGTWHEPPTLPPGWATAAALADLRHRARAVLDEDFSVRPVWGWKDPRTCLTLPFWQQLVPPMRYVICLRNPVDVARSLEQRDGFSLEKSAALWVRSMKSALEHTTGRPRVFTFYDDLMVDWPAEVRRLSRFLGTRAVEHEPAVRDAVQELLEKDLQHHRASIVDVAGDAQLAFPPKAVYMVLRWYRSFDEQRSLEQRAVDHTAEHAVDMFVAHAERELERTRSLARLDQTTTELSLRLHDIGHTVGWRLVERFRHGVERWVPATGRRRSVYRAVHRFLEVCLDEGARGVLKRTAHKVRLAFGGR